MWKARVERAAPGGHRAVMPWKHPRRSALQHHQLRDARLDGGDHLNSRGAGADDRHALAVEHDLGVPLCRMERRALETRETRERRHDGIAERTVRHHHVLCVPETGRGGHHPLLRRLVPARASHFLTKADERPDAELTRHAPQVSLDLRLRRKGATPVGIERERERVERRLHVAGAARVSIVAPRAAQVGGPLEDNDVVDAASAQCDRHADAGEPAPDDQDAGGARCDGRSRDTHPG